MWRLRLKAGRWWLILEGGETAVGAYSKSRRASDAVGLIRFPAVAAHRGRYSRSHARTITPAQSRWRRCRFYFVYADVQLEIKFEARNIRLIYFTKHMPWRSPPRLWLNIALHRQPLWDKTVRHPSKYTCRIVLGDSASPFTWLHSSVAVL